MIFRFAVGASGAPRSCAWRLWTHGDDAYLSQRSYVGVHKFSFHTSGRCRWALIRPPREGMDRAVLKWNRDPIPAVGAQGGSLLLKIAIPTNHLSAWPNEKDDKVRWIQPASVNRALGIELFLTRELRQTVEEQFAASGARRLLAFGAMTGGANFCLAALDFECGPISLKMPARPRMPGLVFGDLAFPDLDANGTGRPIRTLVVLDHELPPTVWELGGHRGERPATLELPWTMTRYPLASSG